MISNRTMRLLSSVLFVTLALVAGCKSGLNERCQLDDDCAEGLVCAPGAMICVDMVPGNNDGGTDAPLDASIDAPIDADLTDAPIDAAIDAP
jgi:hypothetical protein